MEDYDPIEVKAEYVPLLVSDHGHPLAVYLPNIKTGDKVLTVELYVKWYALYLIERTPVDRDLSKLDDVLKTAFDFKVRKIHFGYLDDVRPNGVSAYCDHVPNPLVVRLFARRNGYHLDELADDLITGRWQEEVVNQLVMECDQCDGAGVVPLPGDPSNVVPSTCRRCCGHGVLKPGA